MPSQPGSYMGWNMVLIIDDPGSHSHELVQPALLPPPRACGFKVYRDITMQATVGPYDDMRWLLGPKCMTEQV